MLGGPFFCISMYIKELPDGSRGTSYFWKDRTDRRKRRKRAAVSESRFGIFSSKTCCLSGVSL